MRSLDNIFACVQGCTVSVRCSQGTLEDLIFCRGEGGSWGTDLGWSKRKTSFCRINHTHCISQCGNIWVSPGIPEAAPGQPQDNPRMDPGAILRLFWARLGHPGAIMGPSRGILEPSWHHFGPTWGHLGPAWTISGVAWSAVGTTLHPLGTTLGHLGTL